MSRRGYRRHFKTFKDAYVMGLSLFLWSLGYGLYAFIWPAYVRELGGSSVDLGFLVAVSMLVTSLSALPGGAWADLYDRKWVLIASWAVGLPAPLIFAFAPSWQWLIPGLFFYMLSSFSNPALQAYIVHGTPPERLGVTFNLIMGAFPLGLVVSPPIGGWLAQGHGMRLVFYLSFLAFTLSTAVLFWLSSQRAPAPEAGRGRRPGPFDVRLWFRGFHRKNLDRRVLIVSAAFATVLALQNLGLPFSTPMLRDLTHLDLGAIGRLGSLASLSAFVFGPFFGRLADRGSSGVMVLALLTFAGSLAVMAAFPTTIQIIIIGFALRGAGDGARGLMTAGLGRVIGGAALGQGYGVYNLLVGLFSVVTPYVGGWLYRLGPTWPFWATAVLIALVTAPVAALGGENERVRKNEIGQEEDAVS
ncbi:MAG TPA: MFS transporter [Bacillota bacterium]|jgi:MFS family permease